MSSENSKRDANRVTTLTGVTDDANAEVRNLLVDATTGRLLVSGTVTGGTGDVVGPALSTDNAVVRFDSTTGKLIQNSTVIIGDTGNVTGLGTLNTLTLPASNFVGLTDSQTLTNKTISGASNTISNINLASQVTGNLPVTNLNSGTSASAATYWRGDGTWAAPSGTGDVVGPASATDNAIVRFDATTGKLVQDSGVLVDDNNNVALPAIAAGSSNGTIYKGTITAANRFIHTYYGADSAGQNLFVGMLSGNFTMNNPDGAGVNTYKGSYNTTLGTSNLAALTTGYYNISIGHGNIGFVNSGAGNIAIGQFSLTKVTTAGSNIAIGALSGQFTTGSNNVLIGSGSGKGVDTTSTFTTTVAIGVSTGVALTTGNGNVLIGYAAGDALTSGGSNIIIGTSLDASSATASNEMNIGGFLFGNTSTKVVGIGLTDATSITAHLHLPASTTTRASLRINSGTAPSAPNDGDVWYDATNFLLRSTTSQTIATDTNTLTLTNKTLTSPTLTTPVLGTPSSGTLTNCTGLPISGLVASTSTAIGVGTIELGHASDTTIARVSAGVISVEGVTVDTASNTLTLTNKTITATSNNVAAKSLHSATTVVDVVSATAPSAGQVLTATSSTAATWQTPSGGWSLVSQVQLGSDSTTLIDATSISTDYDIFRITLYVKTSSGDDPYIRLRLNGDTGTNYYTMTLVSNSTSEYRNNTNADYIVLSRNASAEATVGTNNSYSAEITITKPFADQIARLMGQYSSNSSGSMFTGSFAGQWGDVTNKITQITIGSFVADANTFLTGSVCIIEGRNIT